MVISAAFLLTLELLLLSKAPDLCPLQITWYLQRGGAGLTTPKEATGWWQQSR